MLTADINYWAVLVAGVAAMIIGYIWYAMPVFGRAWTALIGKTEAQLKEGYNSGMMIQAFIAALVMAYILAHFVDYTAATTVAEGLQTAFWLWLGFVATSMFVNNLYEGKPAQLWLINAGYQLANLLVAGAILATWA